MTRLMPYIQRLVSFLHLDKVLQRDRATREMVDMLYRRQDKSQIFNEIWCQRIAMVLILCAVALLLFLAAYIEEQPPPVIEDGKFLHVEAEDVEVSFGIRAETKDGMAEDTISLELGEEEESTGEEEKEEVDQREMILAQIKAEIEEAVSNASEGERIELPDYVEGQKVEYINPENKRDFSASFLLLAVIVLLPLFWKQQQREQLEKRNQQLMLDYPEVVNKTMLLFSAGLTVRGCFERISDEYNRRLENGEERRFVYEEIACVCHEMKNGVSETEAVERFGRRCRQLPYLKFSSLVNQNIRKGSEGLTRLLEAEALEAFEKRKEAVKAMGETAGTKLLLPMVCMLAVVMAIIIIPAFMTM